MSQNLIYFLLDMDAYLKTDLSGIVVDHDCYMQDKFANRSFFATMNWAYFYKNVYSGLTLV